MNANQMKTILANEHIESICLELSTQGNDKDDYKEAYKDLVYRYQWMIGKVNDFLNHLHIEREEADQFQNVLEKELEQLADENKKLKYQCNHDKLTGVFSRSRIIEAIEEEFILASKKGDSLALVMLDLDDFKIINDQFGHLEGDRILEEIGCVLKENVRQSDMVGRYGGDEFFILMPGASKNEVKSILDRVIKNIGRIQLGDGAQSYQVTVSSGYCICDHREYHSFQELIQKADRGLLKAKQDGKNRVFNEEVYDFAYEEGVML